MQIGVCGIETLLLIIVTTGVFHARLRRSSQTPALTPWDYVEGKVVEVPAQSVQAEGRVGLVEKGFPW